jgi:hypothetical protein
MFSQFNPSFIVENKNGGKYHITQKNNNFSRNTKVIKKNPLLYTFLIQKPKTH